MYDDICVLIVFHPLLLDFLFFNDIHAFSQSQLVSTSSYAQHFVLSEVHVRQRHHCMVLYILLAINNNNTK